MTDLDAALRLCQAECPGSGNPPGWTLTRAREIDSGSDASVRQAIAEAHTAACIARAVNIAADLHV